jgi:hypothetical protein
VEAEARRPWGRTAGGRRVAALRAAREKQKGSGGLLAHHTEKSWLGFWATGRQRQARSTPADQGGQRRRCFGPATYYGEYPK